ncbi:MAG: RNA-binding protein [Alphaproteobacteria bacterium]|nr:RNA-binding protein [Alphaproteobacteria bacterium]
MAQAERNGDDESGSLRTCIVTRVRRPPEEMLRFVLDPQGSITPDLARKLPGRGVWVSAHRSAVEAAARKGAFARAFRRPVTVPANLAELIETLMLREIRQSLAIANKAGLVLAGAFQVETALAKSPLALLIQARDGSAQELAKMRRLFFRWPEAAQAPVVDFLDGDQIGLALGRTNVIHAALRPGTAGAAFAARCARLAAFLADQPAAAAGPGEEITDRSRSESAGEIGPDGQNDGRGAGSGT